METDSTSVTVCNQNFIIAICQQTSIRPSSSRNVMALHHSDEDENMLPVTSSYHTFLCTEQQIVRINKLGVCRQLLYANESVDLVIRFDVQQVLDRSTLWVLRSFRNFEHFQPITFSFCRKDQQGSMHGSRIDIFYKIFVTRFRTFGPYSAASLSTEFTKRVRLMYPMWEMVMIISSSA